MVLFESDFDLDAELTECADILLPGAQVVRIQLTPQQAAFVLGGIEGSSYGWVLGTNREDAADAVPHASIELAEAIACDHAVDALQEWARNESGFVDLTVEYFPAVSPFWLWNGSAVDMLGARQGDEKNFEGLLVRVPESMSLPMDVNSDGGLQAYQPRYDGGFWLYHESSRWRLGTSIAEARETLLSLRVQTGERGEFLDIQHAVAFHTIRLRA